MATKRKKTVKELRGLTQRQANIIRLRKEINEKHKDTVKVFTAYKIITYVFVIVFPPYALYRIWNQKTTFSRQEQVVQSIVSIIFMYVVISHILGL